MTERELIAGILPALKEAVRARGGREDFVKVSENKNYTSVFCLSSLIFRARLRGTKRYIAVPALFRDLIPPEYPTERIQSERDFIRILAGAEHPAEMYGDFLARLAGETLDRYPHEFDCCSEYMRCSDAKACILPDNERDIAVKCGYRKILNSGRIFYGANRNVD